MSFIVIVNISFNAHSLCNDFIGKWCWDDNSRNSTFSITINKKNDIYIGDYFAVAYGGDKIDEGEKAFDFKTCPKNQVKTKLKTTMYSRPGKYKGPGIVELTFINNKLQWRVIEEPEEEFYAPENAILHRCKANS
jgi:hypothetical protein